MDNRSIIKVIGNAVARSEVSLRALNHITSEESLAYYKGLDQEDLQHNMDDLFTELRAIHALLQEEISTLRDHRLELQKEHNDI